MENWKSGNLTVDARVIWCQAKYRHLIRDKSIDEQYGKIKSIIHSLLLVPMWTCGHVDTIPEYGELSNG
jgi:hypothetical protein